MSVMFCDSNCELLYNKLEELGVKGIKMPYTIDDQLIYYDFGEKTDFVDFYTKVKNGAQPKTQALNAQEYIEYFEPVLAAGEDVLYVHFSSKMSGTFNSLKMAIDELREKYPAQKITTVDTLSISMGAGLIVNGAAKLKNNGAKDEEIVKWVEDNRQSFSIIFVVDDLFHLKRGGRLKGATAVVGSILGIKPILKVSENGEIETFAKVNGRKKAINFMLDYVKTNGENLRNHPIAVLDANSKQDGDDIASKIKEQFGENLDIWRQPVGPVIGSHCGNNVVGIAFHSIKR